MSASPKILVLGNGGHARSLVDSIESLGKYEIAGFVAPDRAVTYRAIKTIGGDGDLAGLRETGIGMAAVGIGYLGGGCQKRESLLTMLNEAGFLVPAIVDSTAVVASDALVGDGTFVGKNAVINANARVGSLCIINTSAVVEHDCVVGDFAHVSVGAVLCGGVEVGTGAMVGAGAVVIQGVRIGSGSIVGAGATVLRDVPSGRTVVGVFNG